jgi:putative nucleotidyltransferase with HDIG domain
MEDQTSSRVIRYLPQVLVATFAVAICPVLLLGVLNAAGVLRSVTLSVTLAMAWSVLASWAGGRYWRSRPHSGDVLFGDLMLWGWVRRVLTERRVSSAMALLQGIESHSQVTLQQRRDVLLELANALEAGDPYTSGHSRRVARYAEEIAKGMGLSPRQIAKIRTAAALHDVGKVRTPNTILHKPGRLTDEEFEVIRAHPEEGAEMVSVLGDRELTAIIRHHHERLDGTGYPSGLARESIPLGARIIAVADTFDAVTSVRPYRGAIAHKKALDILSREAGTQLDPAAVRAFHRYYTGSRPLAIWVSATTAAQRIVALLGGGVGTATASVGRVVLAAALSTTAAAAMALGMPAVRTTHAHAHKAAPAGAAAAATKRTATTPDSGSEPGRTLTGHSPSTPAGAAHEARSGPAGRSGRSHRPPRPGQPGRGRVRRPDGHGSGNGAAAGSRGGGASRRAHGSPGTGSSHRSSGAGSSHSVAGSGRSHAPGGSTKSRGSAATTPAPAGATSHAHSSGSAAGSGPSTTAGSSTGASSHSSVQPAPVQPAPAQPGTHSR